jgi:small subunit ribosomal protein S1
MRNSESEPAVNATTVESMSAESAPHSDVEEHIAKTPLGRAPNVDDPVAETHPPAHVVDVPALDAPVADAPVLDAPVADAPVLDVPVADAPVVDAPVVDAPVVDAPVFDAPVLDAPVGDSPVADAPVADAPVVDAPLAEVPVGDAPVADAPVAPKPAAKKVDNEELRRRAQQAWESVTRAKETGESLSGFVTAAVKGGLLVDVGSIRGFLPASQVRVAKDEAIESLVRTKIPLKILDTDQARRRVVVSHRRALDDERRRRREEVLASLEVGQVREVVVVRLADFGAFVDLGGVDGLIPMSEIALERIEKATDAVAIGDRFPATVLRIDEGGRKIALSRKSALPDPWRDHAALLRGGATVEGTVVAKEPRLTVEIAAGISGTVRANDADPADYEIGEKIDVVVRSVDRRTRRITLALPYAASAQPTSSGFAPLGEELLRKRK